MNKTQRYIDLAVGMLMLTGLIALFVLVIKVSGLSGWVSPKGYTVSADFTDIGGLKVHAPVTIAGVRVGEVTRIELQPREMNARVTMQLHADKRIPFDDVSARILTEGLLGSNYISIVPGFDDEDRSDHPWLRDGDRIARTQEAIILENLIGQLLFNINKPKGE